MRTSPNALCLTWATLSLLGAGAILQSSCTSPLSQPATKNRPHADAHPVDKPITSGEQALKVLLEGNERFVRGQPRHGHQSPHRRRELVARQQPYAVILGCADSRVAPEVVFDAGLGDLFVVRVAGNVAETDEKASIEYAIKHLKTPLVLVMGHESCGAVTAALQPSHAGEPSELRILLDTLSASMDQATQKAPLSVRTRFGVEANVRLQVARLLALHKRIAPDDENPPMIVGGVYDLASGHFRIMCGNRENL